MFLERFKEVENFTITKLPLGGSKSYHISENNDSIVIIWIIFSLFFMTSRRFERSNYMH